MFDADGVVRGLRAAGEAFGPPSVATPVLRWGPFMGALDEAIADEYLTAIELIYEGYLFHYRESRVSDLAASEHETALLAGDFLYARGLRLIAARGDVDTVDLLARLMAACSYLRSVGAPFSADDALWAYTVGGIVALRHGTSSATVARLFNELDEAWARNGTSDIRAVARASAAALALPDPGPLAAELTGSALLAVPIGSSSAATTAS